MNGAAPKLSKFGSQILVKKNIHPNFARERCEFTHSSYTSIEVIRSISAANVSVIRCAILSPLRNRRRNARGPACGGTSCAIVVAAADILLNQRNRLALPGNHVFGKLRIGQTLIVLLTLR